jgi:hypothetical protein
MDDLSSAHFDLLNDIAIRNEQSLVKRFFRD